MYNGSVVGARIARPRTTNDRPYMGVVRFVGAATCRPPLSASFLHPLYSHFYKNGNFS